MRALTLWQPWASLIAWGLKRVETRDWSTPYRGLLAIHAAARRPTRADVEAIWLVLNLNSEAVSQLRAIWGPEPFTQEMMLEAPRSCVVAVATLANCRRMESGQPPSELEECLGGWERGRWAWELSEVHPLKPPVPAKGERGMWEWDSGVHW